MQTPFGAAVPLPEAADALGVPAAQLARWCADGTIAREHFVGWAGAVDTLALTEYGIDALARSLTQKSTEQHG